MKRQARPFTIEIKQKRGRSGQNRSIWGDLDLGSIAAGMTKEVGAVELPKLRRIDSDVTAVDAEDRKMKRAEHTMADLKDVESMQVPADAADTGDTAQVTKKSLRPKKPKAQAKQIARKATSEAAVPSANVPAMRSPRKVHSTTERAQKLGLIEKSIKAGESIKSATRQAGISEQTFYQWKKAVRPAEEGNDLKDLLALEEENERLKKLLAERLRKENAELKRKLGLE